MDAINGQTVVDTMFPRSLCQTPIAAQPGERSFNDPASGQNLEALGNIGPFDDFDGPLSDPAQGILELVSDIAAVCKHVTEPRKRLAISPRASGAPSRF